MSSKEVVCQRLHNGGRSTNMRPILDSPTRVRSHSLSNELGNSGILFPGDAGLIVNQGKEELLVRFVRPSLRHVD